MVEDISRDGRSGKNSFRIRFDDLTPAEANIAAQELLGNLRQINDPSIDCTVERENEEAQDLGTAIALVLGTSSAVAVAKGIQAFIAKLGSRVVIETADGKIIATGDAAANMDVAETARALSGGAGD